MFECNFKLSLEDAIKSAKYVYQSQRRKRDKVISFLIPILIIAMIGLLVLDIVEKKQYMWDIVLIVALVVLEIVNLLIPAILASAQKKNYKAQRFDEIDNLKVEIKDNICLESLIKDGNEISTLSYNMKNLNCYIEDNELFVLVFNSVEFVCINKKYLNKDIETLKKYLNKFLNKTKKS